MKFARSICLLLGLSLLAGCLSIPDRNAVLQRQDPAPVELGRWRNVTGIYTGPLRAETDTFFGTKGVAVADARLEIYGSAEAPLVFFKWNTSFSSAMIPIAMRTESYTNIATRRYGVKGRVRPSSHAPNELLLKLLPNVNSPTSFTYLIFRFHGDCADVDYLGHFGWRGIGRVYRTPRFPGDCR